jgi:hypothetical protein
LFEDFPRKLTMDEAIKSDLFVPGRRESIQLQSHQDRSTVTDDSGDFDIINDVVLAVINRNDDSEHQEQEQQDEVQHHNSYHKQEQNEVKENCKHFSAINTTVVSQGGGQVSEGSCVDLVLPPTDKYDGKSKCYCPDNNLVHHQHSSSVSVSVSGFPGAHHIMPSISASLQTLRGTEGEHGENVNNDIDESDSDGVIRESLQLNDHNSNDNDHQSEDTSMIRAVLVSDSENYNADNTADTIVDDLQRANELNIPRAEPFDNSILRQNDVNSEEIRQESSTVNDRYQKKRIQRRRQFGIVLSVVVIAGFLVVFSVLISRRQNQGAGDEDRPPFTRHLMILDHRMDCEDVQSDNLRDDDNPNSTVTVKNTTSSIEYAFRIYCGSPTKSDGYETIGVEASTTDCKLDTINSAACTVRVPYNNSNAMPRTKVVYKCQGVETKYGTAITTVVVNPLKGTDCQSDSYNRISLVRLCIDASRQQVKDRLLVETPIVSAETCPYSSNTQETVGTFKLCEARASFLPSSTSCTTTNSSSTTAINDDVNDTAIIINNNRTNSSQCLANLTVPELIIQDDMFSYQCGTSFNDNVPLNETLLWNVIDAAISFL